MWVFSGVRLRFIKKTKRKSAALIGMECVSMCVCDGILFWPPASISWAHLTTVAYPVPPFIVIVRSYWGVGPIRQGSCHGCPTTNYRSLQACIAWPDASGGRDAARGGGGKGEGGRGGRVKKERGSSGDLPQQHAVNQSDLDRTGTHLVAAPANTAMAGGEKKMCAWPASHWSVRTQKDG